MDDLPRLVGVRLREARHERGLSLGALAAAAQVGKGSLSEIENGTRNPTLGTLYALAGVLGVPLATLLDERADTQVASPGVAARLLDVSREDGHFVEVYRLRIDQGAVHKSVPHGPGVTEHLLVTAGRVRAGRPGEETEAGPGETATWVSDVAHTYAALGPSPVESVLVIRSPAPMPGKPDSKTSLGSRGSTRHARQTTAEKAGPGSEGRDRRSVARGAPLTKDFLREGLFL